MSEPTRLSDGDQLPPALRDAFRALERDAPSAETVARVQQALQTVPAAAPAAAAVGTLSTGKLLVLMTVIAGSVAATWLARRAVFPKTAPPTARTFAVAETSAPPNPEAAPMAVAANEPGPRASSAALRQPMSSSTPPQANRYEARPSQVDVAHSQEQERAKDTRQLPRARPPVLSHAKRSDLHADAPPAASPAAANDASARDDSNSEANEARAADAPTHGARSATPSAAAAHASEAQLLAQAKRLAARDPESALRQVEALARKYPGGAFAQEREQLAIHLHRRLGHTAIAEHLTQQFQEQYPRSVYRRALQP